MAKRSLTWIGGIALAAVALALVLIYAVRPAMQARIEKEMFVTRSEAKDTPATLGTPFTALVCMSGNRRLRAWLVDTDPNAPAVLIFHGNSTTMHDWAAAQVYLARHGLSSMTFDYSGFGESDGQATVGNLDQDAGAAYDCFVRAVGRERAKFVVGHSLGTAVLLHNARRFSPAPLGIATYGTFNSARALVLYLGAPSWWTYLTADVWNNVADARRIRLPLLVVAGANDTNVPPIMGRQVAIAAPHGDFKLVWDAGHDDIYGDRPEKVWGPILDFMNARLKESRRPGPQITPAAVFLPDGVK